MNISDADLYALTKDLTILLIEDYKPFAQELETIFLELFQNVEIAYDGKEGMLRYQAHKEKYGRYVDIVITDICLPGKNGVEICKEIRSMYREQEVIVMSAHTRTEDLLEFINLGIRRFITKPIDYDELMHALLDIGRLYHARNGDNTADNHLLPLGQTCFWNSEKNELFCHGETVYCTAHELLLLQYLVKSGGMVCTVQGIIEFFYANGIEIGEKSIRNLILKLRQKTGKECIENVYGLGYRLQIE